MRSRVYKIKYTALVIVIFILLGCEDHRQDLAKDLSVYEHGNPVPAVSFDASQDIILSVLKINESGDSVYAAVSDGDYLASGTYTIGVSVSSRKVNGVEICQRVFISDGGWDDNNGNNVEAAYDQETDMYLADFNLPTPDELLITPILVQAIGSDGKASKAKFLVTTQDQMTAPYGYIVDRGFSIALSNEFLATLPDVINPFIAEQVGSDIIRVNGIAPAKNNKDNKKNGVINIDAAGISFDVILNDSKTDSEGDVIRGLYIGLEDVSAGTMDNAMEVLTGIFAKLFLKRFNVSGIPATALALGLGDLVDSVMSSSSEGLSIPGVNIPDLKIALGLDSTLYLNLKGYPSETTSDFAVLGGAFYVPDNVDVIFNSKGYYQWPLVSVDLYDTMITGSMGMITNNATDIGMALSQYNINQLLQGLMQTLSVEVKSINTAVALFSPRVDTDNLDMHVTINPKGIAVDFPTRRIVANDVQLLLVESGEVNGPVSQLSLDITMIFDVTFRLEDDRLYMDLSVQPIDSLCHMHVMKDESDMTTLDHGKFVPIIFQYLSGGDSQLTIPVSLSDLGVIPRQETVPGIMMMDDNGNCFLGMAVESIDITGLTSGDGCFIQAINKQIY